MLDFSKCFTFAIDRIKANPFFYLVAGLLTLLLPSIISFGLSLIISFVTSGISRVLKIDSSMANIFVQIAGNMMNIPVFCLITAPVLAAFFREMESEDRGENAQPTSLMNCLDIYTQAAVACLISSVILGIGFLLCIIPGIMLSPIMPMSIFFVSRGDTAMNAIKKSCNIIKCNPMTIFYTIVFCLVATMACCICIIVTLPMAYTAFYKMMKQVLGEDG